MDIRLEGALDGIDAAQQIRDRCQVPVVYLTAYADDETLQRARVTEPFGYLLKPFEDTQLRTVIEMALYKHTAERKLRESERRYAVTLASIGDAVIATDDQARVTFLNPVAEALTGWPQAEATGRPLAEVFHIINEETRQPVEDPAAKVLRLGTWSDWPITRCCWPGTAARCPSTTVVRPSSTTGGASPAWSWSSATRPRGGRRRRRRCCARPTPGWSWRCAARTSASVELDMPDGVLENSRLESMSVGRPARWLRPFRVADRLCGRDGPRASR